MKYFIIILSAIFFLASCKNKKQPEPEPPIEDTTKPIPCTFGLDSVTFEMNRQAASKKPIKPTPPVPPAPKPTDTTAGVIFLDFDGHTVSGTGWNWQGDIECGPSGLDSLQMVEVINKIKYDYREFKVNVTPDSNVFNAAPLGKKIRVLFTVSWEWYGRAGGVGFVGSFKWRDNSPVFVFTSLLGYNTKYIKEAGSHEAGHSVGLYHQSDYNADGFKIGEYRACYCTTGGVCCDAAPIMGVAYYNNVAMWIVGRNSSGSNQDDKKIISTYIPLK